jgi:hypothetical protein
MISSEMRVLAYFKKYRINLFCGIKSRMLGFRREIEANRKLADWVARLERLTGQKAEYIKTIALPWFCVPIVTYLIACQ